MGWSDDYLEHHGILGQKWGVRRFETAGGKLTPAGKNRYNSVDGKYQKVKKVAAALTDPMRNVKGGPVKDNVERENALRRKYGKKTTFENNQEYTKPVEDASRKANNSDTKPTEKKGLTDKQKKMIIAGAAVAGTALAAYGGYKLYQLNKEAKQGLSEQYHQKAVNAFSTSNKMDARGFDLHNEGFKLARSSGADEANKMMNEGVRMMRDAKNLRETGYKLQDKAKTGKFSLKEKADYLKSKKNTSDMLSAQKKEATNKLASEASSLARSVTMTGPIKTSSKPTQNPAKEIVRKQVVRELQRNPDGSARVTSSAANKPLSSAFSGQQRNVKSFNEVFGSTKGSKTFMDASKANDDLVQELLKKNTLRF